MMSPDEADMVANALRVLGEYEDMKAGENHTIMALKAEITSRAAANKVLSERVDHLEAGLRLAKEQVANLLRLNQQRHDAEPGPAEPGAPGKTRLPV